MNANSKSDAENGAEASDQFAAPPPAAEHVADAAPTVDFSRREFALREWMDEPCTFADYRAAALDLAQANRLTLGYRPTLAFLERLIAKRGVQHEPLHIVDLGCGHGDALRGIARWAAKRSVPVRLTGIDANPYGARLARECDRKEHIAAKTITWITADAFHCELVHPADAIISSLFTHHLEDTAIVRLLQWSEAHVRDGWFINDLARSATAAKYFALIAKLLRWHPMVAHDGPVSFHRAFTASDWDAYLQVAGIDAARIFPAKHGRLCVERLKATSPVSFA